MLKLTTDKHEALRGLSATAELLVDEAIDQWRGRHPACIRAKVGHFEYSL